MPYPIAFVLGGALLAFTLGLSGFTVEPDLVFVLILPPLLFSGGWGTNLSEFFADIRSILLLAIGLVVATTCVVGLIGHELAPELTMASAFVLGAVVSPPDAVAARNVFERFAVPRRIVAILEGEGLVNDAAALVVYGFAVAAVTTGQFNPLNAGLSFIGVSVGGVACGLAAGYAVVAIMKTIHRYELADSLIDNLFALITPYAVDLLGGACHVSSVLATVVAGAYISRRSSELWSPQTRLIVSSVWQLLIFVINAFAFLLIGLELKSLVPQHADLVGYAIVGGVVSVVVIVLRLVWVYPGAYLPRLLPHIRGNEAAPGLRNVFVVGWSGMRGIVSLAAALALPTTTAAGDPFPGRATIIIVACAVIFTTLVFQGLSLIPILRWLKLESEDLREREIEVRIAALEAGITRIKQLEAGFTSKEEWEVAGRLFFEYSYRIDHRLQREALKAEHEAVLRLRDAGEIPDEIFRTIRYDLDLAETRIV